MVGVASRLVKKFRIIVTVILAIFFVVVIFRETNAHFTLRANIRIIHVTYDVDGLHVYTRLPTAVLLAASAETTRREDGTIINMPYTVVRTENTEQVFYLDARALAKSQQKFLDLARAAFVLEILGQTSMPKIREFSIHNVKEIIKFSKIGDAVKAVSLPVLGKSEKAVRVDDTVADFHFFYPWANMFEIRQYSFVSKLSSRLPGDSQFRTVLIDYFGGEKQRFDFIGPITTPITVERRKTKATKPRTSISATVINYLPAGVAHILGGSDHVLFILCLTVGAVAFGNLIWRVTGFTLGHSVTLIAGFVGIAPGGTWFILVVETGIGLSIIYAGLIAILARPSGATFVITALIGLLHGFGFSFMLREVLQADADRLWLSLLSFNIGIEVGQLLIVALSWMVLMFVSKRLPDWSRRLKVAIAATAIVVATYWVAERGMNLVGV